jgi:hypothetical protein
VALLIVGADRTPVAAAEYQPMGQIRSEDAVRDAEKREALRRASIPYIEVRATDQPGDLRADLATLAARRRPPPGSALLPSRRTRCRQLSRPLPNRRESREASRHRV